ncbi:hypothetical protein MK805_01640 [Shimazuella sp. AN120528]|uniref:PqqD family peptide modification chaperone n=1 Tax=Shimazuella soli TaxID=1892854 RepID=UPI001F0F747C|nr:hypothetical protein [Shimazuella soli]MCH5583674.1 hypothetical protein [Shimazuella soli]
MSYQLHPEVKWSEVQGDHSLLDKRTGEYFGLNRTGGIVFTSLLTSKSDPEALDLVAKALHAPMEAVESMFHSFRDELLEKEILIQPKIRE